MAKKRQNPDVNNEQAVKQKQSRQFDHELANEPLTETQRQNNKKPKKKQ